MSYYSTSRKHRQRQPCPQCQNGMRRVHRRAWDHVLSLVNPLARRYRCVATGCGWEGLINVRPNAAQAASPAAISVAPTASALPPNQAAEVARPTLGRQMFKGLAASAALAGAALAIGAVMKHIDPPDDAVRIGPRTVQLGISHDGDRLPPDHPLLVATSASSPEADTDEVEPAGPPKPDAPTSAAASAASGASATPVTKAAAVTPIRDQGLTLRRHCSWGQPGRNPYKGSVELALRSARVPESVVRRIAADVAAKRVTDRLSITNGSIRADASGRRFDPTRVAMTYGRTLCVDTRVNFKKRHTERADLYEAADAKGNVVAVMVPDVCGNVSVLSEVADADDLQAAEAAGKEGRSAGLRRLPQALVYNDGGGAGVNVRPAGNRSAVNDVSAPGTLLCTLTALWAAWRVTRRRRSP